MNSDLLGSVASGVNKVSVEDVNYPQSQEAIRSSRHSWSPGSCLLGRCFQGNLGEATLTLGQHMSGNIRRICLDLFNACPDQQYSLHHNAPKGSRSHSGDCSQKP